MGKIVGIIAAAAFFIAIGYGWISNLISLFHSALSPLTGEIIVRVVGIFIFPIGAIAGLFF